MRFGCSCRAIGVQIYEAAGELCNNVVEHAKCPVGGYMAAQCYKRERPGAKVPCRPGR